MAVIGEDSAEVEAAEVRHQKEHCEQEAEVANAVDDESFLACVRCGVLCEVEADEKVRGETNALPADEEQKEAGGKHQHQHEEHE
jgi:hypothetical protein